MYHTRKTVFGHILKGLKVRQKCSAAHHIFNSLFGVWKYGQRGLSSCKNEVEEVTKVYFLGKVFEFSAIENLYVCLGFFVFPNNGNMHES